MAVRKGLPVLYVGFKKEREIKLRLFKFIGKKSEE